MDNKHADGHNIRLDSSTGFHNAEGDDSDFEVTVDLGTGPLTQKITKMILKKSADDKDKSLIEAFSLQYYDGKDWKSYHNGEIIFTNQKEEDKNEMER